MFSMFMHLVKVLLWEGTKQGIDDADTFKDFGRAASSEKSNTIKMGPCVNHARERRKNVADSKRVPSNKSSIENVDPNSIHAIYIPDRLGGTIMRKNINSYDLIR